MTRSPNTDQNGKPFGKHIIEAVWTRGKAIQDYDSTTWRLDICGNKINRSDYGNINSEWGWEIDHIMPVATGGSDALGNLQPLYWKNNRHKGDTYPWYC